MPAPGGAVPIEAALGWAYRVQLAWELAGGWGGLSGWAELRGPAGNFAAVCDAGHLGAVVDGWTAYHPMPAAVHADALALHRAVLGLCGVRRQLGAANGVRPGTRAASAALDREAALLVVAHARAGTRPLPDSGPVVRLEPEAWQWKRGEWAPVYRYNAQAGIGQRPWLCPLRVVDRGPIISESRRRWRIWRAGLACLQAKFAGGDARLERWQINDMLPPEAPWLDTPAEKGT